MRPSWLLLAPVLFGCRNQGTLYLPTPDVQIEVETPEYGEFMGDADARVTGTVSPVDASVMVDGVEAEVDETGHFIATLPVDHAYRILDVEASLRDGYQRVRVPVFRGNDPLLTWPGGIMLRLTPSGLDKLGEGLGGMVDDIGWDQAILNAIPTITTQAFELNATAVTHSPTVVELLPADDGLDMAVSLRDVELRLLARVDTGNFTLPVPITVGYTEISMGFLAVPEVDDDGFVTLQLTGSDIVFDDPQVSIAGIDGWLLELVLLGVDWALEPIGEALLDVALDSFGTIELGGPYVFDTDLLGTQVEIRLSDLFTDVDGVGAGLGMGLNEPALVGELPIPVPTDSRLEVHASLGVHEGLMQLLLDSGMLDLISQDLTLPGTFGEIIGGSVRALPGGDDAPEADGWCLSVDPGTARVARLQTGIEPLAVLYMPDVIVDIGTLDGSTCVPWLTSSLVFEVGFDVRAGTQLSMSMGLPEGAVLFYGTGEDWDEAEVIEGLSGFLGGIISLLGGQFSFDLADLFGGLGGSNDPLGSAFGEMELEIVDSQPLVDEDGNHPEGLYSIGLSLWAE